MGSSANYKAQSALVLPVAVPRARPTGAPAAPAHAPPAAGRRGTGLLARHGQPEPQPPATGAGTARARLLAHPLGPPGQAAVRAHRTDPLLGARPGRGR